MVALIFGDPPSTQGAIFFVTYYFSCMKERSFRVFNLAFPIATDVILQIKRLMWKVMPSTKYTVYILNSGLREMTTDYIHTLSGHSRACDLSQNSFYLLLLLLHALILSKAYPLLLRPLWPHGQQFSIYLDFPFPADNSFYIL